MLVTPVAMECHVSFYPRVDSLSFIVVTGLQVEFSWDRVRLFDQNVVQVPFTGREVSSALTIRRLFLQILFDDCMEARGAKIESVSRKPKTNYRPQVRTVARVVCALMLGVVLNTT